MITAAILAASLMTPASVGVGISGFPVCMDTAAQPGHTYTLSVSVVNTGDSGESVSLRTGPPVNGLTGIPVPASWVSFGYPKMLWVIGQSSVSLAPGQSATVPVTVSVPGDADPGLYGANLVATSGGTPSPGGGMRAVLGAAAEDDLSFAVAPAKAPSCDPHAAVPAKPARPAPGDACPTATAGPAASAAPSYCPGAGSGPSAAPAYSPAAASAGAGDGSESTWMWIAAGLVVFGFLVKVFGRRS